MKKLMIAATVALCATVGYSDGIESSNTVGYQNKTVTVGDRAMRSASTFLNVGENPTAIKLSDIKQTVGDPGDLVFCTYNDNVTRLAQYIYVSAEAAAEAEIDPGWYILDSDGMPDVEAGVKNVDLPYGQGCVINSLSSSAEYTSAGEVDSIKREFSVPVGARKMMGNVLPRDILLSELKQTVGDPGDLIFCTYDNNVTRLAQYIYVSAEAAAEAEIDSGWYILDSDGMPDVEAGVKDFTITSGQGFVINSLNSSAVLQFPKAINN